MTVIAMSFYGAIQELYLSYLFSVVKILLHFSQFGVVIFQCGSLPPPNEF